MYWSTITVLIINAILGPTMFCSAHYGQDGNVENVGAGKDKRDCWLSVANQNTALRMPIPYTKDARQQRHTIVYPDVTGRLHVKYLHGVKFSCATAKFASDELNDVDEALVVCGGGNTLWYNGRGYRYADFVCDDMPRSELTVTGETCQPDNYTVVAVGFKTKSARLDVYKVCFDTATKNSLYSWYGIRSPYYNQHQPMKRRPSFVATRQLYGRTNVNKLYSVGQQRKTVASILRSDALANKYILNDNNHSMSRGHFTPKADLYYGFEQTATFYYANVAPQWQAFNGYAWNNLEMWTRSKMDNGTGRVVIVTGTYGSCTLPDVDGVEQPLYLDPPVSIPVPLFYWKLHYDVDAADGVVYIGLNNPYLEIDDSLFICPNICPKGYDNGNGKANSAGKNDANNGLIYCCTKESFENAYGKLDPIVFLSF